MFTGDGPDFRGTEPVEPNMPGSAAKAGGFPSSGERSLAVPIDDSIVAAVLLIPPADDDPAPVWPLLWADWSQEAGPLKLFLLNLADRPRDVTVDPSFEFREVGQNKAP